MYEGTLGGVAKGTAGTGNFSKGFLIAYLAKVTESGDAAEAEGWITFTSKGEFPNDWRVLAATEESCCADGLGAGH